MSYSNEPPWVTKMMILKARQRAIITIANSTCMKLGIDPEAKQLGPFLGSSPEQVNRVAIERWIFAHYALGQETGHLPAVNQCTHDLERELRCSIPDLWLGD